MKKRTKLVNEILFDEILLVTNVSFSKLLLMMNLFKLKCFLVNLLREIYQLCMIWLYITHKINIYNLNEVFAWVQIKWHLPWHSLFFGFQVFFAQSFASVLMKELKYIFNWGSFFWLNLFCGYSLRFLSIIIISSNWEAVFDLDILY